MLKKRGFSKCKAQPELLRFIGVLLIGLFISTSCKFSKIEFQAQGNTSLNGEETSDEINISALDISNISPTSFDVSVDFSGDDNSNASAVLYYCNETDSPGCSPTGVGSSQTMTRNASAFTTSVTGLSSPNDPLDQMNVEVVASDPDGSTNSPLSGSLTLDGTPGITISSLNISNVGSSTFDVSVDFSGDDNSDANVDLFYCNETDNPGCDPSTDGTSKAMTRNASTFTTTAEVSSPNDPTDQLNVEVVATDPDGTVDSPLSGTLTLDGTALSLSGSISITNRTKTGFTATVNYSGDTENNGSVALHYCNDTDSSGCDPVNSGTSVSMTRNSSDFSTTISGLSSPNDEADWLNIEIVATDPNGTPNSPKTDDVVLAQTRLESLDISGTSGTGFTISAGHSGDSNANATATLYYCNDTDSPGCNPENGTSVAMTRNASDFSASVSGLSSPNDPTDVLNVRVIGSDPEGIYDSPRNDSLRLADLRLGDLHVYRLKGDQFYVDAEYSLDDNSNGSATLHYCNETDSPGCNPEAGTSTSMTRNSNYFTAQVTGLSSPNDPGDSIHVRVTVSDPDTAYGGPKDKTFGLPNPTDIYRSVGFTNTTPLATGDTGAVTISGTTATFANPLPDNIGVGDAIQYDTDGGGDGSAVDPVDAIAFITERSSSTQYTLQSASGGSPLATTSDTDWSIFRAYTTLADAESGDENTGIDSALRNFDTWSNYRDISSVTGSDEVWHIALYNDAPFTTGARFSSGWDTTLSNYVHIFAPSASNQVGVDQRHSGKWTTQATRFDMQQDRFISLDINHSIIEGIQIHNDTLDDPSSEDGIYANSDDRLRSEHVFRDNIIFMSGSTGRGTNGISITACRYCYSINNIIAGWRGGVWSGSNDGVAYIYNNTIFDHEYAVRQSGSDRPILKNSLAYRCESDDCLYNSLSSASDYNVSDDSTSDFGSNSFVTSQDPSQLFMTFSDDGDYLNDDFRILDGSSDLVGRGTDLSSDPIFPFSLDIEGQTRSIPWDVGADQL